MPSQTKIAPTRAARRGPSVGAAKVGKKLEARNKPLRKGPRGEITAHLRKLFGDRSPAEISKLLGCTEDAARKFLRGDLVPKMDDWPMIAKALGLPNWQAIIPPPKK